MRSSVLTFQDMCTFIVVYNQSRGKVSLRGDNRVLSLSWFCFKFVLTIEIQTMINFASYFCEIVLHEVGNKSLYLSIINSRQILKGEMRILQTTDQSWRSDMVTNWYWGTQVPRSDGITSLCGYSSVGESWKVFVYVNGRASAL